jgi:hypothetical protein
VTEIRSSLRLDLVPREDEALPTGADVGHNAGISEALGYPKAKLGVWDDIRRRGIRGQGGADSDDRHSKQWAEESGCAHVIHSCLALYGPLTGRRALVPKNRPVWR